MKMLLGMVGAMLGACVVVWVVHVRRRYRVVRIIGTSMVPTLVPGERLLLRALGRANAVTKGEIVVLRSQGEGYEGLLVKRVVGVEGDTYRGVGEQRDRASGPYANMAPTIIPAGYVAVQGDGPESTDSRSFGFISRNDILGRAVRKL